MSLDLSSNKHQNNIKASNSNVNAVYEFEGFCLDAAHLMLSRCGGEEISLTPKVVETLLALIERGGEIVPKNELMKRLWANAFVEESNLIQNIYILRKTLGETSDGKPMIETLRRRGYRFNGKMKRRDLQLGAKEKKQAEEDAKSFVFEITPDCNGEAVKAKMRDENTPTDEKFAAPIPTNGKQPLAAPINQSIVKSKPRARQFAFIATIFIIAFAGVGFALYKFVNAAPERFEAKKTTRLTSSGRVKVAAVSPDGKFIVYTQEERDGQQSVWMQHIGSESKTQIAAPAEIEYHGINISPDGNSLYYVVGQGMLFHMPILGGAAKKIADGLNTLSYDTNVGISPDGKQIAFVRHTEKEGNAIFIVNADGINERKLAASDELRPSLAWSPDGKIIAARAILSNGQNILAVRVTDGTSEPVLAQGWIALIKMAWLPDSKSLLAVGWKDDDSLSLQIYQTSYPSGDVHQITDDTNNYFNVVPTSDGRFLTSVKTEQVAHIWAMPTDDLTQARQLTDGFEKYDGVSGLNWTFDGKIVFDSKPSGKESISTVKADGNLREAVKDGYFSSASPDGRFIVYQKGSTESGDVGLYRTDMSEGRERQLTKGVDVWASVSSDNKWVVYTHSGDSSGRSGLWKIPIEGGEPMPIFEGSALCPAISPDGKTIAFVLRKAKQPNRIALVSSNGGEIIKAFDAKLESYPLWDKQNLQWTPDGRGIYFVSLSNGVSNIWQQPIDGSAPMQITNFKDGRIFNFAFSPDGRQLALSRGAFNSDVVLIENANPR